MKKFYVEYKRNGKTVWCVVQGDRVEDVEYTVKVYGFEIVSISEI